jgi:flagellar M-ring protein FliF
MNPDSFLDKLKQLTGSFSPSQMITLGVTFVLVIGVVVGSAMWLNTPTYRLLLSGADQATTAQVITQLKERKVPYQLDEGGGGVRVPASRLDELRLEILSQGLPNSGQPGWEVLSQGGLGITDFVEKANYRRALEGEISRTIASITEVESARVHIAIGKESPFGASRPTTASVTVKLKGNRKLPAASISGITNLVAYSVEGLRPDSVVVVDTLGNPLASPRKDDDDPQGGVSLERQQEMERQFAGKVRSSLEDVAGPGRVNVNVSVRLNTEVTEQTREEWDPAQAVVRSSQTSTETSQTGTMPVGSVASTVVPGTAGARANAPPPAIPAGAPGAGGGPGVTMQQGPSSMRSTETKNNEIGHVTTRTVQPSGEVARLSVAVVIDHKDVPKSENGVTTITRVPRTAEEMSELQEIVRTAVGFDEMRGDVVTIKNISFHEPVAEEMAAPSAFVKYSPQIEEGARILTLLVVVVLTFLLVVRPLMRRLGAPTAAAAGFAPTGALLADGPRVRTIAEMENQIGAELDAKAMQISPENLRLPVLTKRITESSQKEPEHVAKVLRSWMNEQAR